MHNRKIKKGLSVFLSAAMLVTVTAPDIYSVKAETTAISISNSSGYLESVYAAWEKTTGVDGYVAYIKKDGEADSSYKKVDNELIREYKDHYRVDVLGLAAGKYVLKVVPVEEGVEQVAKASITDALTVQSYDRTGFAFVNGTASGAYNEDGTLKSDAVVLYVTEETKDTISLDVVTSSKGAVTKAVGIQNILDAIKKGYDKRPIDIRIIGTVTDPATLNKGNIMIDSSKYGLTLEGVGEDAVARGFGIFMKNSSNVEIRNMAVMLCDSDEGDNYSLQQDNDHIWVHNCDSFYGMPGSDKDQAKGDGALDCKKSTYVTFSYNHFFDNGKCNLLGLSENKTDDLYITYHHNWYDHSDSRHPRVRYYSAHVYNNYYDGNAKYGVGSTKGSSVFVENNYFRNCPYPMLTSMQGSDIYDASKDATDAGNLATFSKEPGGTIKSTGNYMTGEKRYVPYGSVIDSSLSTTEQFDCYEVENADEIVPSDVKSASGGNTYNNFDTSSIMYDYTPDTPEVAKENVEKYAGRVNGGDFKWTFTDEDDSDYDVNAGLMSALMNYSSDLVSIGGLKETSEKPSEPEKEPSTEESEEESKTSAQESSSSSNGDSQVSSSQYVHSFTENGLNSSFFRISGKVQSDKGTTEYKGLTLTAALKMETATSITFDAPSDGKLVLVFGGTTNPAGKKVKYTPNGGTETKVACGEDGIVTLPVTKGTFTVKKGDSINLFYMQYIPDEEPSTEPSAEQTEPSTEPSAEQTEPSTEPSAEQTEPSTADTESTTSSPEVPVTQKTTGIVTNLSTVSDSYFKNIIYVSASGKADADGTKESPMDVETAISKAVPGQAILLLDGTYTFDHQITIPYTNSGDNDNYKVMRAADGANVVFDFSSESYNMKDTSANERGIQVEGDYWYIEGITVKGAADNGMFIAGKNNVIERCILQANRDSGLQISRRDSTLSDKKDWPSGNLILNCTSFDNCDPATGENADGFASKLTCGDGNVFDGCIAYSNIDDGWDLYAKTATGSIGVVTLRNCVSFSNGFLTDGSSNPDGDRNGFKLGGSNGAVPTNHIVDNCLAFNNGKHGFTDNGNGGALSITNCSSYNNKESNFAFDRTNNGIFNNLVSVKDSNGTSTADKFVGTIANSIYYTNKKEYYSGKDTTTIKKGDKIGTETTITADDFVSMNAPLGTSTTVDADYRNEDGTVNMKRFFEYNHADNESGSLFGVEAGSTYLIPLVNEELNPEPETEAPTEPETEAPTEPETEAPTEPETEAPTEPETEAPTEPETEAPTEPETEAPTEPETEAPTEPETEAPTEPETEAPTEPETEAPTEPETEAPTEPETEAPTEPETEAPTEPETEAPTAPEAETEPEKENQNSNANGTNTAVDANVNASNNSAGTGFSSKTIPALLAAAFSGVTLFLSAKKKKNNKPDKQKN